MPYSIGSGAPLAPHGPFSSAPYPDSFMGTHKDGAGQLWDQTLHSVMGFLWSRFLSGSWQALSGPVQRSDKTLPALAFSTQGRKKKKKLQNYTQNYSPTSGGTVCIWGGFTAALDLKPPHLDVLSAR